MISSSDGLTVSPPMRRPTSHRSRESERSRVPIPQAQDPSATISLQGRASKFKSISSAALTKLDSTVQDLNSHLKTIQEMPELGSEAAIKMVEGHVILLLRVCASLKSFDSGVEQQYRAILEKNMELIFEEIQKKAPKFLMWTRLLDVAITSTEWTDLCFQLRDQCLNNLTDIEKRSFDGKTALHYAADLFSPECDDPFTLIRLLIGGRFSMESGERFPRLREAHNNETTFEEIVALAEGTPGIWSYDKELFVITCCLIGGEFYEEKLLDYLSTTSDLSKRSEKKIPLIYFAMISSCSVKVIKRLAERGMKFDYMLPQRNGQLEFPMSYAFSEFLKKGPLSEKEIDKLLFLIEKCKDEFNHQHTGKLPPYYNQALHYLNRTPSKHVLDMLKKLKDCGAFPPRGAGISKLIGDAAYWFVSSKVSNPDNPWELLRWLIDEFGFPSEKTFEGSTIFEALKNQDCKAEHFSLLLDLIPWDNRWCIDELIIDGDVYHPSLNPKLDILWGRGVRFISNWKVKCLINSAVVQDLYAAFEWLLDKKIEPCRQLNEELARRQENDFEATEGNAYEDTLPNIWRLLDARMREGKGSLGQEFVNLNKIHIDLKAKITDKALKFQKVQLETLLELKKDAEKEHVDKIDLLLKKIPGIIKGSRKLPVEHDKSMRSLKKAVFSLEEIDKSLDRDIQSFHAVRKSLVKSIKRSRIAPQGKEKVLTLIKETAVKTQIRLEDKVGELSVYGLVPEQGLVELRDSFLERFKSLDNHIVETLSCEINAKLLNQIKRKWQNEQEVLNNELQDVVSIIKAKGKGANQIRKASEIDSDSIEEAIRPYKASVEDFAAQIAATGLKISVPEDTVSRDFFQQVEREDKEALDRLLEAPDYSSVQAVVCHWKQSRTAARQLLDMKIHRLMRQFLAQKKALFGVLKGMFRESSLVEDSQPPTSPLPQAASPVRTLKTEGCFVDLSGGDLSKFKERILEKLDQVSRSATLPAGTSAAQLKKLERWIQRIDTLKTRTDFQKLLHYLGYNLKVGNGGGHLQYEHGQYKIISEQKTSWTLDLSGTRADPQPRRVDLAKRALLIVSQWATLFIR